MPQSLFEKLSAAGIEDGRMERGEGSGGVYNGWEKELSEYRKGVYDNDEVKSIA